MAILILGLVIFLGVHSVRIFAPAWRDARVASMGEMRWKGIYSLVSLVGLVVLIWGYALARPLAPVLYVTPFWMVHLQLLLMALSFIALAASQLPAGRLKPMLKHPMLVAVKLWAFGHLLVNGDLASVLLFGTFLVWAVLDRISAKRRNAPIPAPGPVLNDVLAVVIGLVVYGLFIWKLHEWLIGVPVPLGA